MKKCSHCGEMYSYNNFHKNKAQPGGYSYICKTCAKKASRKYLTSPLGKKTLAERKRRPEHVAMMQKSRRKYGRSTKAKVANKRYAQSAKFKIVQKRYQTRYAETIKPRNRARWAVKEARRQGKLPAPATLFCDCGQPAAHYHHYLGYAKEHRLAVVPVCTTCHGIKHRKYP